MKLKITCAIAVSILLGIGPIRISDAQSVVVVSMPIQAPATPLTLSNPIPNLTSTSTRVTSKILTIATTMGLPMKTSLELVEIARCESLDHQDWTHQNLASSSKELLSTDYGIFQINDYYNGKAFDDLGLDYKNSEDDNIAAAMILYQQSGTKPWSASAACWDKVNTSLV